jgi:hypothetical protein
VLPSRALFALGAIGLVASACAIGCTSAAPTKKPKDTVNPGSFPSGGDDPGYRPPRPPDYENDDSGVFGVGDRPKDGGDGSEGGRVRPDDDAGANDDAAADRDAASSDGDVADAALAPALCATPLAAGDLAVVELMIASTSGAGDRGEWIEVQSRRDCILNVKGLHVESPRGTGRDTLTIGGDLLLPPNGTFVIANASDTNVNHALPSPIVTWDGQPADVLKNDGDTITLTSAAGVTIDNVVYPALSPQVGRSISFPVDCAWSDRGTWARWSFSSKPYSGALQGTPNADNDDVACH